MPKFFASALLFFSAAFAVGSVQAAIPVPEGSRIALAFKEPGSTSVAAYHGDTFMIPASTQKLLTALAATLYFGPDWQFKTRMLAPQGAIQNGVLKGDLVLQFDGAPDLTRQTLVNLLAYLKQQKITQIEGDILLDVSGYGGYDHGDGWSWNDLPICLRPPPLRW